MYSWGNEQGENGLDGCEEGGHIERLEKDLGGNVPVLTGVERGFCQQDRVLHVHTNGVFFSLSGGRMRGRK